MTDFGDVVWEKWLNLPWIEVLDSGLFGQEPAFAALLSPEEYEEFRKRRERDSWEWVMLKMEPLRGAALEDLGSALAKRVVYSCDYDLASHRYTFKARLENGLHMQVGPKFATAYGSRCS